MDNKQKLTDLLALMTEEELHEFYNFWQEERQKWLKGKIKQSKHYSMLDACQEECESRGIDFRPEAHEPFWYHH